MGFVAWNKGALVTCGYRKRLLQMLLIVDDHYRFFGKSSRPYPFLGRKKEWELVKLVLNSTF